MVYGPETCRDLSKPAYLHRVEILSKKSLFYIFDDVIGNQEFVVILKLIVIESMQDEPYYCKRRVEISFQPTWWLFTRLCEFLPHSKMSETRSLLQIQTLTLFRKCYRS